MPGRGRSKDLVALVALLCAASYGTWLWMRSSMELGGGWTDGEKVWTSVRGEKIRYAVWDEPEPLAGLEGERASRPALSPDGRWLVVSVGERGLNADLYVAEIVSGVPTELRPLSMVNGPADELAPAFAPDALYFATDRTGTGDLDIWRAPYASGSFAPPEPMPRGVNGPDDETDPWPLAGGGVAFASNRPRGARRDFELYHATPTTTESGTAEPGAPFTVEPLDSLNTPFDERDPALSSDGRTLVFASDRLGSRGGFDLYRSFLEDERWLAPDALHGVNDAASQRGPSLSRDGFTLYFDRAETEAEPSEIWRAESLELFRVPGPPISWREIAILSVLLVLALLAWLAKRWTALEIIYKCFLISLLVHLLMLWYLREVYPESEPVTVPGEERAFRVRIAPSEQRVPESSLEREGQLEAMRTESPSEAAPDRATPELSSAELAQAAPSAAASLEALATPEPVAPARATAALQQPAATAVQAALQEREAPFERLSGEAPGLVVTARPAESRPAASSEATPVRRVNPAQASVTRVQPEGRRQLQQPDAPTSLDTAPRSARLERAAVPPGETPTVTVARPTDNLGGPSTAPAPALALPDAPTVTPRSSKMPTDDAGSPSRLETAPVAWQPQTANAPSSRTGTALTAPTGPRLTTPERPASEPSPARRTAGIVAIDVRAATDAGARESSRPTEPAEAPERFDALAGLAPRKTAAAPRPTSTPSSGPARLGASTPQATGPLASAIPSAQTPLALPSAPEPAPAEDRPPTGVEETPYKNRFGGEKLRALEEFGGSKETERAVAAGLAYLASIQNQRGYWGSRRDYHDKYGDVRIGKTGLAMLAFLGAGHTPRSGAEHAAVTERAIDFLLSQLDASSGHFGDSAAYGHGIATYALAECYALTRDPVLERPLRRAVDHILDMQNKREDPRFNGGWGYYFNNGRVWNNDRWPRVSVTAWQVMALESARLGGLEVPDTAFQGARTFLQGAWDKYRGAFRYSHDPARLRSGYPILPASTPAALFALSLLGQDPGSRSLAEARRFVLARKPQSYSFASDDDFVFEAAGNLYFWYYGTLAMFRTGGGSWRRWNEGMKEALLPSQETDGSWQPISIYARYAGDDGGDRSYTTAMCVLTLEVYYRYFTPLLAIR